VDSTNQAILLSSLRDAQRHAPISGLMTSMEYPRDFPRSLTVIAIDPDPLGIRVECLEGSWLFTEVRGGGMVQTTAAVGLDWVQSASLTLVGTVRECSIAGSGALIGHSLTLDLRPRHRYEQPIPDGSDCCPLSALERFAARITEVMRDTRIEGEGYVNGSTLGGRPYDYSVHVTSCRIDGSAIVLETSLDRDTWRASAVIEAWVSVARHWHRHAWNRSGSVMIRATDLAGRRAELRGYADLPVVGVREVLIHGWPS